MAEIGIAVASKVAESMVVPVLRPAIHHAQFLFCAGKIKRNLDSMKAELKSKQESVYEQKQEARNRNEITVEAVEKWLNEVSTVMEDVGHLEEQMKEGSSCCWGWCSTLKGYRLCKQFAKITDSMKRLNQNGEFNPFSHPIPIPDIEFFSSENFVCFESTKSASRQLLEALQDHSVNKIGLYGMGGCGKTTLVKEVGNKAKELKLFDHVVFTVVSKSVIFTKIQQEIADLLNFKFRKETKEGRARELSLRLQTGEKILLILDDVWSRFNLEEDIGISLYKNCIGCKVLLTTRLQQVCTSMGCEKKIQLSLLSSEEAWTLFQKNVHVVDDSMAHDIVQECKGLPIAIVAVARSLKDRSVDGWKVALNKLRTAKPIDTVEGEPDVYSCLKLSYDHLPKNEARLLLKICSMFPEDHKIPLEELFRYGIGLGICKEEDSFEEARSIVNVVIEDLIYSSLLLPCENEDYMEEKFFNIHDMVRDVILWIAFKEDCTIKVDPEGGFNAITENESIKDCYGVSLWNMEVDQFPLYVTVAPKLRILLLHSFSSFSHVSFEGLKGLKVMSMIHISYPVHDITPILSLSISSQGLNNLHTLRLIRQELEDISFIISLRRLKILDLEGSILPKLPNGIENMKELRLMDLSNCNIPKECYEVIGRYSQLAELYILFKIALPYRCFLHDSFPKLQRYRLNISNNPFSWRYGRQFCVDSHTELRAVSFVSLNISKACATIKGLLQRAFSIYLGELVGGCKSIIPEFVEVVGKMNELTKLYLRSCSEIECILDTTSFHVKAKFPMLVKLEICSLHNLKEVIRGSLSLLGLFEKLEYLKIQSCCKLTSLFPLSAAQSFLRLEDLIVENCSELKHIIKEEKNGTDSVEKEIFPNLKHIKIENCGELEYIFPISVARTLLSLQNIEIKNCGKLMNKGEGATSSHNSYLLAFPLLKKIYLNDCPLLDCIISRRWDLCNLRSLEIFCFDKLTSLFPLSVAQSLFWLEDLTIRVCGKLKHIIIKEEKNQTDAVGIEIFPNLKTVDIQSCDELEYIFSFSVARSLRSLQKISIMRCEQLKQIIMNEGEGATATNNFSGGSMFPQLTIIYVASCSKLECIIPGEFSTANLELGESSSNMAVVINYGQVCNQVSDLHHGSTFEEEQQKIITPDHTLLDLDDLPDLMFIWNGPTLINFHKLAFIKIVKCRNLKFIFPACVIRNLPQLTILIIKNCKGLEQVFGFASENHDHGREVIELKLPKLIKLMLIQLPNLTDFSGDLQFQLKFQALKYYKVRGCPKFSSITNATIENFLLGREGNNPDNYSDGGSEDTCNNENHSDSGFEIPYDIYSDFEEQFCNTSSGEE